MQRPLVAVILLVACAAPLWAVSAKAADQAVGNAFPAMDANRKAHLVSFLLSLSEGQVLVIGFGDRSASFTVKKDVVEVEVRGGMPALPQTPAPVVQPQTGPDAKPWERPGAAVEDEIIGPDGGRYVWVPEGQFTMGSTDEEIEYVVKGGLAGGSDWVPCEKPAHLVTITRGFWLGKCEVTNAQYRAFCEATGTAFPPVSDQPEDHPVVNMYWEEAKAYCNHFGMRLPTEAEWEYAARGPQGWRWPWGDDWDDAICCTTSNRGPEGSTFPVGMFPDGASWCGALDLAGNVEEWCADWFDAGYYAVSPATDPAGPRTGTERVIRGGSHRFRPWNSRAAYRGRAGCGTIDLGFRAVIVPK
jgi:formylglycine-generating enzyme required for sulfatase activity